MEVMSCDEGFVTGEMKARSRKLPRKRRVFPPRSSTPFRRLSPLPFPGRPLIEECILPNSNHPSCVVTLHPTSVNVKMRDGGWTARIVREATGARLTSLLGRKKVKDGANEGDAHTESESLVDGNDSNVSTLLPNTISRLHPRRFLVRRNERSIYT
ncbi:hypothetical protein SCHPADRAFT_687267 [Schizopora paradoxa]|uniref:Uncharacterized protein n=1 Tax=Schizopora paradoxa TaxID=27342 RepID=A0A0H2R438_9AGAM|nr:hypothetical protein SCHPADRAFT_687267 [Schizopora paradoxa]